MPGSRSLVKCAAGALLLAACSAGGPPAGQAVLPEETAASPASSPEEPRDRDCSAGRLMLEIGEQDLPDPVAEMRHRLIALALICDFDALGNLVAAGADENSDSLGGVEPEPAVRWRELERTGDHEPLANLIRILSLDPGTIEVDDASAETVYVWPAVAAREAPSRKDWAAMTSVFDKGLVEQLRRRSERVGLGYLGWRVAINSSGDWVYYALPERD